MVSAASTSDFDQDRIAGLPRGPRQHEMRKPQVAAHLGGVGGDGGGVRMRGVHDRVARSESTSHRRIPSTPPNPPMRTSPTGSAGSGTRPASELITSTSGCSMRGERAGLRGAAQQQHPHQCRSSAAPGPVEYR